MTQEELSLLDEREREAWELCQKATPDVVFDGSGLVVGDYRFVLRADGVGWTANDFAFFAAARNLLEPLLQDKVRLTQELKIAADCVVSLKQRAEAAESRISDLTKELEEEKVENTKDLNAAGEWRNKYAETKDFLSAAESERDRYKERAGVLEKFVAGIDPFCRTIHGDDECNWCGRERPRDIDKWEDAQREEHHNADCEFITILKGGN